MSMNVNVSNAALAAAPAPFDSHDWRLIDDHYLPVGQICLHANPMPSEPFTFAHVKPLVVGHLSPGP
jgi:xylulose-5-phosphate/fructose-6-phosphate phosphoketolase